MGRLDRVACLPAFSCEVEDASQPEATKSGTKRLHIKNVPSTLYGLGR